MIQASQNKEREKIVMPRRDFLAVSIAGSVLAASAKAFGQTDATPAVKTGYAPVNGLKLYYEIHGTGAGEPLVLLHGGLGSTEMFGDLLTSLSKTSRVITPDLQAHGRTADIDRPISYEALGDDIAALMKHLGIEKADVMGYSLGAGTALQTTIRHPAVVRKLVVVSTVFKRDGWYPEILAAMAQLGPAAAAEADSTVSELFTDRAEA